MIVNTKIQYRDGRTVYQIVDWDDRTDVRNFAIAARKALVDGATVITKRIKPLLENEHA